MHNIFFILGFQFVLHIHESWCSKSEVNPRATKLFTVTNYNPGGGGGGVIRTPPPIRIFQTVADKRSSFGMEVDLD